MLGLQPPLVATRSLGASAAPLLGPPLSAPLAHAGAVSPPVAAVGFWLSGGVAVYVKYGPHAQELDPTLKLTLFVGCGIGLLSTCVLLGLAYAKDRDLRRTLNQSTTAAGGMKNILTGCSAVFVVTLVVLAFACYDSRRDPQPPANPHVIRLTALLSCQFIAELCM